jgi:hypothetical protein
MAQTREKTDHLFYNRKKHLRPILPHLSAPVVAPRIQLPPLAHTQHVLTPARHLPCSQTIHTLNVTRLDREANRAYDCVVVSGARQTGTMKRDSYSGRLYIHLYLLPAPTILSASSHAFSIRQLCHA